ncbi:hypothetical protein [Tessaracoccus sp. ZS01]|uniref:hypothetical protein n=1 Tax=Tessaracoccus sp. ZS01 TaxID=1906324 RepID=UPI0013018090|nr:hypothetical protein [Tessaracoccus sp. ZS01]
MDNSSGEDFNTDLPLIVGQLLLQAEEHLAAGELAEADELLSHAELFAGDDR